MRIDIAGVEIDNFSKQEVLDRIADFVSSGKPHYAVTVYSEFVVKAQTLPEYKNVLNRADLSLADGVGILWAAKYLSMPAQNSFQAAVQVLSSGLGIVFKHGSLFQVIKEQISGSRFLLDLAAFASKNGYSMALFGGSGEVAQVTAEKLKEKFPGLKINLAVAHNASFNKAAVMQINASNSDILVIAYQPPKQEVWLAENLDELNVKLAIGLGGTFDYFAGKRKPAPDLFYGLGLEWLWRLITQPWRMKRMWNAIAVFTYIIYREKVKNIYGKQS